MTGNFTMLSIPSVLNTSYVKFNVKQELLKSSAVLGSVLITCLQLSMTFLFT